MLPLFAFCALVGFAGGAINAKLLPKSVMGRLNILFLYLLWIASSIFAFIAWDSYAAGGLFISFGCLAVSFLVGHYWIIERNNPD